MIEEVELHVTIDDGTVSVCRSQQLVCSVQCSCMSMALGRCSVVYSRIECIPVRVWIVERPPLDASVRRCARGYGTHSSSTE